MLIRSIISESHKKAKARAGNGYVYIGRVSIVLTLNLQLISLSKGMEKSKLLNSEHKNKSILLYK